MVAIKPDSVLLEAREVAHEALVGIAEPDTVGEHVGSHMLGERLAAHYFACTAAGYVGWRWLAILARAPRQKHATICETFLEPGEGSLLAPDWVPYAERLAPGDLRPGDVTAYDADDPNLEPGFEATGKSDVDQMAFWELGLGRPRVLSSTGRVAAAQRWYDGESGPRAAVAAQAPAPCRTCGYFLPMAGALRAMFGVCTNEWSPDDARAVSLDHGCGAHSEVDTTEEAREVIDPPILDDYNVEMVTR